MTLDRKSNAHFIIVGGKWLLLRFFVRGFSLHNIFFEKIISFLYEVTETHYRDEIIRGIGYSQIMQILKKINTFILKLSTYKKKLLLLL